MPNDPRKQLWVTEWEARVLEYLLSAYERKHSLIKQIRHVLKLFGDDAERLSELVKRANANSFWINGGDRLQPRIQRIREERKKNHRKIEEEIAHLPADKVQKIIKKRKRGKGRAATTQGSSSTRDDGEANGRNPAGGTASTGSIN